MKVVWIPSPKFTAGHPAPLIAQVRHRMVGTLRSTDVTFTTGSRVASTNFGIGKVCGKAGHPAGAHVHQYVRLGDQAWGNGNNRDGNGVLVPSAWNSRYPTTLVNSRTISIEHEDRADLPAGDPRRGVVTEDIIAVSIELGRLLHRGNVTELKAAGIVFRAGTETAICRELRAMKPGPTTIIDHHYIAGPLKPYCWRPYAADKVGFPQARVIAGITGTTPAPAPTPAEEIVKSFPVPETRTLVILKEDPKRPGNSVWMFTNTARKADGHEVSLGPAPIRPLVLISDAVVPGIAAVAYEPVTPDADAISPTFFVLSTEIASRAPSPSPDVVAAKRAGAKAVKDAADAKAAELGA